MERMLSLLLLGVLRVSAQTFTCGGTNNATVCSALGDFYYATNGASRTNRAGWSAASAGTPTNYCTSPGFYGAMCGGTGSLSGSLFTLCACCIWRSSCAVLMRPTRALSALYSNKLNGTIPSSMAATLVARAFCVCPSRGN